MLNPSNDLSLPDLKVNTMDTDVAMEVDTSKNEVDNIQIFTKEFLDHNRTRENELRSLKTMVSDYEMKNASLETNIKSINATISGMDQEIETKKAKNAQLYGYLTQLRSALYDAFKDFAIPGTKETLSKDNIEQWLPKLLDSYSKMTNPKEKEKIKQKISSVLTKCQSFEGGEKKEESKPRHSD